MGPPRTPAYEAALRSAQESYAALPPGGPVRLAKRTSNLFRNRAEQAAPRLDLSACQGVFALDREAGLARVGGLTTYERLVDELLPHGFMPLVVPQLRTITIGGAVVGLGIESTSFRNGLPHESVVEADVLTGDGQVVTAAPDGEHADLHRSLANSYGTLGYTLGLVIELERTSPYVVVEHHRFRDLDEVSATVGQIMSTRQHDGTPVDFLDGVVFSAQEAYLTLGRWATSTEGLRPSDYTGPEPYYRSIQHRRRDVLTAEDYLWRWDTDWFWCSRAFGAQHPAVRRLWPRRLLRSDVYWRIMRFEQEHGWYAALQRRRGRPPQERVIQDVEIPLGRTADFLRWFLREVPIEPVWLCPVRLRAHRGEDSPWPHYPMRAGEDYVNVGFWSAVDIPPDGRPGDTNRAVEDKVTELGGHKGLYSDAFYDEQTFRALYGGDHLDEVKARYDPHGRFPTLYDKAVRAR
ncbi:FAD-binding oxidoreductase [Ornithinimicrobium tianjinense]|uniref:Delta(24)-sterol reductase n=1 Tax=Ornithinimicrobium tianjinense TaxID=1195761 RepID=A0A917BQW5_9MICO|nr:FAD-binding oxidoreductase [Ornithinimicrobium tianjinense]GGF55386.1 FAD-linked oxidase [Ornithinimicrobium tianjinense]